MASLLIKYVKLRAVLCANLQTGGIFKSKSPNAQHRTPISLTTLQAIVTLSGKIGTVWKAADLAKCAGDNKGRGLVS